MAAALAVVVVGGGGGDGGGNGGGVAAADPKRTETLGICGHSREAHAYTTDTRG